MRVASPRVLLVSFVICLALGAGLGTIYALIADKVIAYGIGTVLFIVGVIALAIGLLGAIEPPEGWATRKKNRIPERRSLAVKVTKDNPALEEASPWALAIWGLFVGGASVILSLIAFTVAGNG